LKKKSLFETGISGVLSRFAREGQKPHAPVNIVADFAGGGLMCALAIMSSLYEIAKKPEQKGKVIDMSMVEGAAYVSSWLWSSRDLPGLWGNPTGANYLDGGLPRYDTYETKDGKFMASGGLEPQFYKDMLIGNKEINCNPFLKVQNLI
jgi:alpha-methylacyl-CoA racemase